MRLRPKRLPGLRLSTYNTEGIQTSFSPCDAIAFAHTYPPKLLEPYMHALVEHNSPQALSRPRWCADPRKRRRKRVVHKHRKLFLQEAAPERAETLCQIRQASWRLMVVMSRICCVCPKAGQRQAQKTISKPAACCDQHVRSTGGPRLAPLHRDTCWVVPVGRSG
ncbi:hypothetical protein BD289DRAFT_266540 [Coniella lustricola]|uniref:Uncharacterized protein n=1 Tax=Coniella lustricola TaxID=2025994 RepID=A0A2T3A7D1_9PEZI|nr:hypothetical protein BD289DRAFT_266540 [Coniella lustricola]